MRDFYNLSKVFWPNQDKQFVAQLLTLENGHTCQIQPVLAGDKLEFKVQCSFKSRVELVEKYPEWYFEDHIVLLLNPNNDNYLQRMVAVTRSEQVIQDANLVMLGEELTDRISQKAAVEPLNISIDSQNEKYVWKITISIDTKELLGSNNQLFPLGLAVKFGSEEQIINEPSVWPKSYLDSNQLPFDFGVLHHSNNEPIITKIELNEPKWAIPSREETVHLVLENTQQRSLKLKQKIHDTLGRCETREWAVECPKMTCNARFPFEAKWAPIIKDIMRIEYELCDERDVLYHVSYPVGFDSGIIVREPFGLVASAERPLPSDQNFMNKYREWLFSKLPNWELKTTKDGAPSDFYLKAKDEEFDLNLMDQDILKKIAKMVHSLFEDWQDGLSGLSMILHHPLLTTHSSSWAKLTGNASSETVLRFRGCFCSDTSRISAEISEYMGELYGISFKGYSLGLRGHLTGLVETPIGEVLIDPMLGITYFNQDNTSLATLNELRENKAIQEKSWYLAYCHGHEFFYKKYNQNKRKWKSLKLSYPI